MRSSPLGSRERTTPIPARPPLVANWAETLYAVLLLLYPTPFREEYGEEMEAAFADRWADVRRGRGAFAPLAFFVAVLGDTLRTAAAEHLQLLQRDLRHAWRNLTARQHLPFSLASGTTLALGIGGAVAIFALVHAVLLAPLPYRDPGRVVHAESTHPERGLPHYAVSVPDYLSFRAGIRSFTQLAAIQEVGANLSGAGEPERLKGMAVAGDLFKTLGLPLVAGREFTAAESAQGSGQVALVGAGLWHRRFGGDPALVGRLVRIDGAPRTVIGIAPQDVGFASDVDIWLPLPLSPGSERGDRRLDLIGRLAPEATVASARSELDALAQRLAREFPQSNEGWRATLQPVREWIVGPELRTRLLVLLAAVGVLLLVACANVANLQVARAAVRLREIAVRLALGASPGRVVRHLMTENLLLAALGGAAGLGLAWLFLRGASAFLPPSLPRLGGDAGLAFDPAVAGFALVLVVGTGLVFGLAPSLLAARNGEVALALRQGGRSGSSGGRSPVREGLVVTQLALATLLAIGAALLAQSFLRLQQVPLGFSPERILTARLSLPEVRSDADLERGQALCDALLTEVRGLPGVSAAGLTSEIPMGAMNTSMEVGAIRGAAGGAGPQPASPAVGSAAGAASTGSAPVDASWRIVTSGYLQALRVPLRHGRFFAASGEPADSVLLSEGLARRLFPGADPLGRRLWLGNGQERVVVGVVGDVRQLGVAKEPTSTLYFSTSWYLWPTMTLVVHASGDPAALAGPLRRVMARIAPEVPLFDVRTLQAVIASDVAQPRLQAWLVAAFAGLALLLAAVGIAGVVAYAVAQRTPELAVRAALGASPRGIVGHVLRRGLVLCVGGVSAGVALAALLGGGLRHLLFGVRAWEPGIYAGTALVLFAIGALGCWLPARRAAFIPPVRALQGE